jgi:iron complex outermembrane recepter protein
MKNSIISHASMIAVAIATLAAVPAVAQDTKPAANDVEAGDIVVTATREKTLLSKTPIAMTAISGDSLRSAGVTNAANLADVVPNFSIDRTNGLQITIRGITSTDGTEKGDPSAAFLADGVYLARPQQADVAFFDFDHVEVLRGPQGTLYGRNTTAGVVNLITNKPELGKFAAGLNAGYGNYSNVNVDGFVNFAVGDKLAFRLSAAYDQRDNFIKKVAGDPLTADPFRKNFSVRAQAYFEVSDNINLLLRGTYSQLRGTRLTNTKASNFYSATTDAIGNPIWIGDSSSTSSKLVLPGKMALVDTAPFGGGGDSSTKNPSIKDTTWGIDGELNWDFGPVKMTYLGSYHKYKARENQNLYLPAFGIPDAFPAFFDGDYDQNSQELRFATTADGPFKAQVGGYYYREKSAIGFYILNSPFAGILNPTTGVRTGSYPIYGFPQAPTITKTVGVFGQVTFKPTDSIRLTAGVRYTSDDKYRYGHTIRHFLLSNPIALSQPGTYQLKDYVNDARIKSNKVTWRVGFDADVGKGLLYGSVATGYKQGGFGDGCSTGFTTKVSSQGERCDASKTFLVLNDNGTTSLDTLDPQAIYYNAENVTAYELGYRGRVAPGVRIDASVFYYEYKDQQLSSLLNIGGAPTLVTQNAGQSSVKGLELEAVLNPAPNHQVTLGLDLLDAHYKKFCPGGTVASGACTPGTVDFAGRKLDRSPSTVVYGRYDLTVPAGEGKFLATVATKLTSKRFVTNFGATPVQYVTPSHSTTDITLTYSGAGDKWYIQGYGKNLENFITVTSVDGFANALTSDPRTYGIRAGFKF